MAAQTVDIIRQWASEWGFSLRPSSSKSLENWLEESTIWDANESFFQQLGPLLKQFPELEAGIDNLVAFLRSTRSPLMFMGFLDRDRDALPVLLRILSVDSPAAKWLINNEDSFDWLRLTAGLSIAAEHMRDVIVSEVLAVEEETVRLASMQAFRRRETLRIICAYCLHDVPWHEVLQQLSFLAEAALAACWTIVVSESDKARRSHSYDKQIGVLGIGAIGASELDFASPIHLEFLIEHDPTQDSESHNRLELSRFVSRVTWWLTHPEGFAYQLDSPFGREEMSAVTSELNMDERPLDSRRWLQQIENQGRTLHRMSLLKTRYLIGNRSVIDQVQHELSMVVFRRNITGSDIVGLSALYRRIARGSTEPARSELNRPDNVLAWRDELIFLIQYLQLIHGSDDDSVRLANSQQAIDALASAGHLTESERAILHTAYNRFLPAILKSQIRSGPLLDTSAAGTVDENGLSLTASSSIDWTLCKESIARVRQILEHMQADAFSGSNRIAEETDLVLDPDPSPTWVESVLQRNGFQRSHSAFQNLRDLAKEEIKMLSTRRCRHFLASIAPKLLAKIRQTPDPDLTLENLASTTRSLGGKGVLWELFSVHEPSLDLYIRICGASPYIVSILTKNPGMIDELLDSLMLNRLPTEQQLEAMLYELCRGAESIEAILSSFKSAMHLSVGVRDILGKESVTDTHRALSDIADVCLRQLIEQMYGNLVAKFGIPKSIDGSPCRFGIVSIGKYGGREPNYHSDMSLLCVYESEGQTAPLGFGLHQPLPNSDFFHQLAFKVTQTINRLTRTGRLYEARPWMATSEPTASMIAWRLDDLEDFFVKGNVSPTKRLEYCSSRCIYGEPHFVEMVEQSRLKSLSTRIWTEEERTAIRHYRWQLEEGISNRNLKRGRGGTMEVEILARSLALQHANHEPKLLVPGTLDCISRLLEAKVLKETQGTQLRDAYNFLREVESGLRLMNTTSRHDLPSDPKELERLAYVLYIENGQTLVSTCNQHREIVRGLFDSLL